MQQGIRITRLGVKRQPERGCALSGSSATILFDFPGMSNAISCVAVEFDSMAFRAMNDIGCKPTSIGRETHSAG